MSESETKPKNNASASRSLEAQTAPLSNPLDEAATECHATLDRVMRSAPSSLDDKDLDALVAALRTDRAIFVAGKASDSQNAKGTDDGATE